MKPSAAWGGCSCAQQLGRFGSLKSYDRKLRMVGVDTGASQLPVEGWRLILAVDTAGQQYWMR